MTPHEPFAQLARLLPRIAEEGGDAEAVAEADLVEKLAASAHADTSTARVIVGNTRRLLQALAVLDARKLAAGEWRFVSFPASLLARSLLNGLGTPDFRLLEPGFWDASDYRVDKQRNLIQQAEQLRADLPGGLVPIRRVWVAWAWLALDGRFLLVRREDPAAHRAGSRGQFVFPGGRVSPQDLPELPLAARLDFFDPFLSLDTAIAANAFRTALLREIDEELEIPSTGLIATTAVREPIRYTALEGAKSTFSVSEYLIQPFKLELNDVGKTALLRCLAAHPERFDWFTPEELAAGVNAAGATAFVDAIRTEPPLDVATYALRIGTRTPLKDPVEIPGHTGESFNLGITGRERQVHAALDAEEVTTLAWLAAVNRHELAADLADGVSVASGSGWVLVDNEALLGRLKHLAAKLGAAGLPLLDFHERAVRLNTDNVHFQPSLMSLDIQDEKRGKSYRLILRRLEIRCPLGAAPAQQATVSLPEILGTAIYALTQGDPGPALDNIESVKRMQRDIRPTLKAVGAKLLIRQVDGVPELVIGR